ncbi:hypothetical protein GBAR_LOCUS12484 [Geodia barretti]|uniref:Secreted protein n=1 Tax=Geodia barretti TaxID=519541 RepID=A0AA35WNJ4_GEOBA|nr:hypothetical protein GBAR_LOCUS12484 [Geodia barretti]
MMKSVFRFLLFLPQSVGTTFRTCLPELNPLTTTGLEPAVRTPQLTTSYLETHSVATQTVAYTGRGPSCPGNRGSRGQVPSQ